MPANKNHSLYIYNADGELEYRVFFSDDEQPDYDNPQWQKLVSGGVVLKIDPAVYAGLVDPIPQNFNGKLVHHDLDKLLLPEMQKISQIHADALQMQIDNRETVWAAEAQVVADQKAKEDAFVAALDASEKQRLDSRTTRQDYVDFYNSLSREKQAAYPFIEPTSEALEAAADVAVSP